MNAHVIAEDHREQTPLLAGQRLRRLVAYNIVLAVLSAVLLLLLVTLAPYTSAQNTPDDLTPVILITALLTMLAAGAAGGTLCNLRGLFKHIDRHGGRFPLRLELPFYIRPLTGSLTGLFTFFVGSLVVSSLSVDAASLAWASLPGRIPYIAVALLAGFAAQEFMQRLKEVAKTLFSQETEQPEADAVGGLERLAALRQAGALSDEEFQAAKARLLGPNRAAAET